MKIHFFLLIVVSILTGCDKVHLSFNPPGAAEKEAITIGDAFARYAPNFEYRMKDKQFIVVNFIEFYCVPCFEEIPILEDIKMKTNKTNIEYVAFYTRDYSKLKERLKSKNFSYILEKANSDGLRNSLCNIYRLQRKSIIEECYLPSTFVIDVKNNKIITASLGRIDDNRKFVETLK